MARDGVCVCVSVWFYSRYCGTTVEPNVLSALMSVGPLYQDW